jgi:hypothetical protein
MSDTARVECPKCGEELTVRWWTEEHKVNNGIGMQTAAKDYCRDIDNPCECNLDEDDLDYIFESAADNYQDSKADYADYKYNNHFYRK